MLSYCLEQHGILLTVLNLFQQGKEKPKIPKAVLPTTTNKIFLFQHLLNSFPLITAGSIMTHTAK